MNPDGEESWLSGWEQQCISSVEEQPDYEDILIKETDSAHRTVWATFQDSATSIAQLYRDRFTCEPGALWVPFQTAAGTVTALYKESCDGIRRTGEAAVQCGYNRRNKELISWAKRRRHHIRREDLLAYLAGKPPPPKPVSHHRSSPRPQTISPPPSSAATPILSSPETLVDGDTDLRTFREALVMSPLSRKPRGPELCAFITGEIARHCKRPASPSDVTMDSPTHQKRQRFM